MNHLLVVGFYLINIGFVCLYLKRGKPPTNANALIEAIATKVGIVMLILGVMHFFNLYVFNRMRKRALLHEAPPPLRPVAKMHPIPAARGE
ncbi:MAG: hypothetical protein ACR2OZ_14470 [Verrucomicrobiales bacterium]